MLKNNNHAGEGSGVLTVSKFEPATQKANLYVWLLIDVVVEVRRIGSGRNQQHNSSVRLLSFFGAFLHPIFDRSAIRRIAKDCLPPHDLVSPLSASVK